MATSLAQLGIRVDRSNPSPSSARLGFYSLYQADSRSGFISAALDRQTPAKKSNGPNRPATCPIGVLSDKINPLESSPQSTAMQIDPMTPFKHISPMQGCTIPASRVLVVQSIKGPQTTAYAGQLITLST